MDEDDRLLWPEVPPHLCRCVSIKSGEDKKNGDKKQEIEANKS
jgi:hypothetical protein